MARTLENFVGTYDIRLGKGHSSIIQPGYQLVIGQEPNAPQSDGIRVGVAIFDPATCQRVLPLPDHPPAYAYLVDGTLNGSTYVVQGEELPELLSYQISLMTLHRGTELYRSATITLTYGDPESAGVWGAEDSGG